MARWVRTYADAKPSELVMLVDSYGLLSIALDRRVRGRRSCGLRGRRRGITVVPPPGGAPVRPGTTIALAVLLVLILGAALLQFVFQVGP